MKLFNKNPRIYNDNMISVILAQNYVLTPFDLRAPIFGVDVELSAYYRGKKNRKNDLK